MLPFVARPTSNRPIQVVYEDCSICEAPCDLSPDALVAGVLSIYVREAGETKESFTSKCKTLEIRFEDQPVDDQQDSSYDKIEPLVLCFILSIVFKNQTAKFRDHLKNRIKGLDRACRNLDVLISDDADDLSGYLPTQEALEHLREFFDYHKYIRRMMMELVFGYANSSMDMMSPWIGFAREVTDSLEFTYMTDCKMIEDNIIEPQHGIIMCPEVRGYLAHYNGFKRNMERQYGSYWTFAAILDPEMYHAFKKKKSAMHLWIYAAIIGSKTDISYNLLIINRKKIQNYADRSHYAEVIRTYEAAVGGLALSTGQYSRREADYVGDFMRNAMQNAPLSRIGTGTMSLASNRTGNTYAPGSDSSSLGNL